MSDQEFIARWIKESRGIPEQVLPWERSRLPSFPENPTAETVAEYVKKVNPYLRRGRWWFRLMVVNRALRNVWAKRLGKIIVVSLLIAVQQIYTHVYLQTLQERASQIGSTLSIHQAPYWPWDWWTAAN